MTHVQTNAIRNAAWHYIEPSVAACAGLTVPLMQQFCAGAYHPSDEQLFALAKRFGIWEKIKK